MRAQCNITYSKAGMRRQLGWFLDVKLVLYMPSAKSGWAARCNMLFGINLNIRKYLFKGLHAFHISLMHPTELKAYNTVLKVKQSSGGYL